MNIIEHFTTVNTTALKNRKIEYIVIHYAASVKSYDNADENIAKWFNKESTKASADFIVDDDSITVYNADINNRYTWHCGGSKYNTKGASFYGKCTNKNSIGIEVCSNNITGKVTNANDSNWYFTKESIDNLRELTKKLMSEFNISADNVIRHYDVTGKLCPGVIGWNTDSGSDAEWESFKKSLTDVEAINDTNADVEDLALAKANTFDVLIDADTDADFAEKINKRCTSISIADYKLKLTFNELEDFLLVKWCFNAKYTTHKVTWRHYNADKTKVINETTFLTKLSNYKTTASINSDSNLEIELIFEFS